MTYDPGRDPQNPLDVNPKERPYRTNPNTSSGMNMGVLFGILALLLVGGFLFFSMNRPATVAMDNRPEAQRPATTGAGPALPRDIGPGTNPAAQRPAPPPVVPAPK